MNTMRFPCRILGVSGYITVFGGEKVKPFSSFSKDTGYRPQIRFKNTIQVEFVGHSFIARELYFCSVEALSCISSPWGNVVKCSCQGAVQKRFRLRGSGMRCRNFCIFSKCSTKAVLFGPLLCHDNRYS